QRAISPGVSPPRERMRMAPFSGGAIPIAAAMKKPATIWAPRAHQGRIVLDRAIGGNFRETGKHPANQLTAFARMAVLAGSKTAILTGPICLEPAMPLPAPFVSSVVETRCAACLDDARHEREGGICIFVGRIQ